MDYLALLKYVRGKHRSIEVPSKLPIRLLVENGNMNFNLSSDSDDENIPLLHNNIVSNSEKQTSS